MMVSRYKKNSIKKSVSVVRSNYEDWHHVNYISHTRKCSCMIFFYYLIGMKNDGDHNLEKIKS